MYDVILSQASQHDSGWPTTPEAAIWSSAAAAQTTISDDEIVYYGFDFSDLPSTLTVKGIGIRVDAFKDHAGGSGNLKIGVELSSDGGSTWTTQQNSLLLGFTSSTFVVGGPDDDHGHTWTYSELTTANDFRVRISAAFSSVTLNPTWHLAYVTATVFYTETTADTVTIRENINLSETADPDIDAVEIREKIDVHDSGSRESTQVERAVAQLKVAGTTITELQSDSDFAATAERPKRSEGMGAVIQLGLNGPTLFVGDATVLTDATVATTYPYSHMQAGLLSVDDLTDEASFLGGDRIKTVEVRVANKTYVDQADTAVTTPKTIGEHSLGLPNVGRGLVVYGFAESGDGWKKRILFNGDIEEMEFTESEVIVRGLEIGTANKAVPDIVVDEDLMVYEPGSAAVDTGDEIEGIRGRAIPIGLGRFDYGAVVKPENFAAGHPFRFSTAGAPPFDGIEAESTIALFPAMLGLKHPMMPAVHAVARYRRINSQTNENQFVSFPWQNIFVYGSRKSSPELSVFAGPENALQQTYPGVDCDSVTTQGTQNFDRYVMVFTWNEGTEGSRGLPVVRGISSEWYTDKTIQIGRLVLHSAAGVVDYLGFPGAPIGRNWSDGTGRDTYGIFINNRAPDFKNIPELFVRWPGAWQAVSLAPAGLSPGELYTQTELGFTPPFTTVSTDDPRNAFDFDDPTSFARINDGGSLSVQMPTDASSLGKIMGVRFCVLWNESTSTAVDVNCFARFGPRRNYAILNEANYNHNKNTVLETTDYPNAPSMKFTGVTDRCFASFWISAHWNPREGRKVPKVHVDGSRNDDNDFPRRRWKGEWDFVAWDETGKFVDGEKAWEEYPTDAMIKVDGGQFDVIACWFEVVFESRLNGSVKELRSPLASTTTRRRLVVDPSRRGGGFAAIPQEVRFQTGTDDIGGASTVYVTGKGAADTDPPIYTSTAHSLIEHPADMANALIRHYLGDAVFDARATGSAFGSFDTARTLLTSDYRLTVVYNPSEPGTILDLMRQIGQQSRSIIRQRLDANGEPQWYMIVDDPDPATNDTARIYTGFTNGLVRWDNMAAGTFNVTMTPYQNLASSVRLRYGFHLPTSKWSGEIYCTPTSTNFTTERANYMNAMAFAKNEYRTDRTVVIDAPDMWDPVIAEILCKYHCDKIRRRRVAVEFETYANAFDLTVGHVIQFDDEIGDRIKYPGDAGAGAWSGYQFNVTQVSASKSAGQLARVFVRAEETYTEA